MSKRSRTLLLSAVALAVLGALLAVLLLLPSDDGDTDSDTTQAPDRTVSLINKADGITLSSVQVTTPDETFTIEPDSNGDLVVRGYETLPQYTSAYTLLQDNLLSVTASRLIADTPKNPEDFGFDKTPPATALKVAYSDGSTFAFELGDLSPNGEGYYLRKSDSAAIYLIDADFGDTVAAKSTSYLSTAPLTAPTAEEDDDELVVRDVTLTGTVRPQTIAFQISDEVQDDDTMAQVLSGFYLTKPYVRTVQSGSSLLSASSYYGFSATDIVKVNPTAADLKAYGMDTPYSACEVSLSIKRTTTETNKDTGEETSTISFYNTFRYTIKLGKETESGERYAVVYDKKDLIPLVYTVSPDSLEWATTQYDDLADTLLFFTYIDQVDRLSVTLNGKTTAFELTHLPNEEDRDDQLKVVADGKAYNTADFRTVYQQMMNLTRTASLDEKPTGDPELTIAIQTNTTTAHSGWIKLYVHSAGKYAVLHDTGEMYLTDAKAVSKFIATYQKYLNGESLS